MPETGHHRNHVPRQARVAATKKYRARYAAFFHGRTQRGSQTITAPKAGFADGMDASPRKRAAEKMTKRLRNVELAFAPNVRK